MMTKVEDGFKNEENASQLVQKEPAVMTDEMGSGSIVCSEASTGKGLGSRTFARPPSFSFRWNKIFIP